MTKFEFFFACLDKMDVFHAIEATCNYDRMFGAEQQVLPDIKAGFSPIIFGDIEVATVEKWEKLLWAEGKEYAESLGEGWHMPTKEELEKLCDNKYFENLFIAECGENAWAWSASEYDDRYAWVQRPRGGYKNNDTKFSDHQVIPCRRL